MPPPVPNPPVAYGPVFTAIEKRLRDRYKISIRDHIGELVTPEMTGTFDPSMGGRIPALGGPRNVTIPGYVQSGKVLEGSTVLQGITFVPKDFQLLLELFREVSNSQGKRAFHYHPLKLLPPGAIRSGLKKAEQFLSLEWLNLSYAATKVGMTKETEQLAWGFREIADTYNVEIGRVQSVTKSYPGENRFILKFGQSPAAYARQVDITSLHVALTNAACNIHIDDVGFVLRGPRGGVGLNADFAQHLIDELLRGSILRDWLATKYGSASAAVWAIENLTIMLPSSDRHYAPTAGVKFDVGRAQFTAAFTMGCKCLRSERLTLEERLVPIPEGNSIGIGFRYDF